MSTGTYVITTRASGTVLTAAIYNADHQNHVTNQNPQGTGAYSDNAAQMQLQTSPGGLATESLPTSLAGELERLRYRIAQVIGRPFWYEAIASNFWPNGQCRLTKSGANLVLLPHKGNKLVINNRLCSIPDGGLSLAPSGLGTALYYIYALDSNNDGVADSIAAVLTAYSVPGGTGGIPVRSDNTAHTLVGMARSVSNAWVDSLTQRFVASWYNRKPQGLYLNNTVSGFSTSGGSSALSSTPEIVGWAEDHISMMWDAQISSGGTGLHAGIAAALDASAQTGFSNAGITASSVGFVVATGMTNPIGSDGYHTVGLIGTTTTATACTFIFNAHGIVMQ